MWGNNPHGQLGLGHYDVVLTPTQVKGLPKIKKIACGSWHTMALDNSGKVWTWGRNENGMLGNNSEINSTLPVQLELENIKDIGGGCFQSIAIAHNNDIFVWGENWNGQLGIGNYRRQLTPTKALLNFENEFQLSDENPQNVENETLMALGLESKIVVHQPSFAERAGDLFSKQFNLVINFVKYNKKFILSFFLNIFLIWLIYSRRRKLTQSVG